MDINLTLFGEALTFLLFVWFTMKFVWPPLMKVMEERRKHIADGIAAGEQGRKSLELAEHKSKDMLADAKAEASGLIEKAHQRGNHIVEEAKQAALAEGKRLLQLAEGEIAQEANAAREKLMADVTNIAVAGAEKILKREINATGNDELVKAALDEMADGR